MTEDSLAGLVHLLEPEEVVLTQISQPSVTAEADRFLTTLRGLREYSESLTRLDLLFGGRVLLVGPPGTDFRTFVDRLATEFPIRTAILNTSHLISSPDRLSELIHTAIEFAKRSRPVLLYVAQLHAILKIGPAADDVLRTAIDSVSWDHDEVLFVASTTRPEELTPEVVSVFDRCLIFRLPTLQERKAVLESLLKERSAIDLDALAESTEGWSHMDLVHLVASLCSSGMAAASNSAGMSTEQLLEKSGVLPLNTPMALHSLAVRIGTRPTPTAQRLEQLLYPDDFLDQLYLMAVGDDYVTTLQVIETLNENRPLSQREREFLLRYPFVLAGRPEERVERLARAKKTMDRLSRVLGR